MVLPCCSWRKRNPFMMLLSLVSRSSLLLLLLVIGLMLGVGLGSSSGFFSGSLPLGFDASPLVDIVSCSNCFVNISSSLVGNTGSSMALELPKEDGVLLDGSVSVSVVSFLVTSYYRIRKQYITTCAPKALSCKVVRLSKGDNKIQGHSKLKRWDVIPNKLFHLSGTLQIGR